MLYIVLNYRYNPIILYTEESTKNWLQIIPDNLIVQNNKLKLLDSVLGEGNYVLAKYFTLLIKYKIQQGILTLSNYMTHSFDFL